MEKNFRLKTIGKLKKMFKLKYDYEFNLLKVENYNLSPRMIFIKKFIENHSNIDGDYFEFGVFQGSSIISVALIFKLLRIKKKLYGFDSFGGFPNYHEKDQFIQFNELFKKRRISKDHYKNVLNLKKIKQFLNQKKNKILSPENISTSADFSDNSLNTLKRKIKLLKLDNIKLIKGDFQKTIPKFFRENPKKKIFIANIDCDLYKSYELALNYAWPSLTKKGIIYLDEYYSLKFPGARIASNEFFKEKKIKPKKIKGSKTDFERWYIQK